MSNTPPATYYDPATIDAIARQFTPAGARGIARAIAVRANLESVPPGLARLGDEIAEKGATVWASLPTLDVAGLGDLFAEAVAHGFSIRAGRFMLALRVGK